MSQQQGGDQDRRTFDPTPQRIREFRKRGEIARSKELTGAATMFFGGVALVVYADDAVRALQDLFRASYRALGQHEPWTLMPAVREALVIGCIPTLVGGLVALFATTAFQLGAPPALSPPKFDISKPFKMGGLKEMLSAKQAAWRTLKSLLKVVFVGLAGWVAVVFESEDFVAAPPLAAPTLLERGISSGFRILLYAGGALLLLSVVDYIVAKRRMAQKMKMTPEEFKRDMKQTEGDPEIKKARRRKMAELVNRRIAVEVPKADFVVVNPTHYAVAMRYRAGKDSAPRVVAKGTDALAARIREIARSNEVPIISKPPLARLLYRTVKEGKTIPHELFAAVAEVLSYVYRLKRRAG